MMHYTGGIGLWGQGSNRESVMGEGGAESCLGRREVVALEGTREEKQIVSGKVGGVSC